MQDQDKDIFDENPAEELPEPNEEATDGGGKGGGALRRILLLVLLLVVVAGGGFYFFQDTLLPPPPAPPQPAKVAVKKPVNLPSKPKPAPAPAAEQKPAQPVEASKPSASSEAVADKPAQAAEPAPKAEPEPTPKPGEPKAEQTAQQQTDQQAAPAIEETTSLEAPSTEKVVEVPDKPAPAPALAATRQEASQAAQGAVAGDYIVQAGAFLFEESREQAERKLIELGFEPTLGEGEKRVTMTRLLVGSFNEEAAQEELAKVSVAAPDAFLLHEGGSIKVYAGSYFDLDKARSFADRLYQAGVRVEEETAEVTLPLAVVRCGPYADLQVAREAAETIREAGMSALVVKN